MNKQHILNEIKRTAAENGGKALGRERFAKLTGISAGVWSGRSWARWSEAVSEAGFAPNLMNSQISTDTVLGHYVALARKLGRLPVNSELRLQKRPDPEFPNDGVFARFGSKQELIRKVADYCAANPGNDDVAAICAPFVTDATPEAANDAEEFETGYVYLALMTIGREKRYKIGKANSVEQRTRQIAVTMPEEFRTIHRISTDMTLTGLKPIGTRDSPGKRRGGEWFELTADDVRAFKRRKSM